MAIAFWSRLRKLGAQLFSSSFSAGRQSGRRRPTVRLALETLEARNLLSGGPGGSSGGPSTLLQPTSGSIDPTQAIVQSPGTNSGSTGGSTSGTTNQGGPDYPVPPPTGPTLTGSGGTTTSPTSTSSGGPAIGPTSTSPGGPATDPTLTSSGGPADQQAPTATLVPVSSSCLAMVPTLLLFTNGPAPSTVIDSTVTVVASTPTPTP